MGDIKIGDRFKHRTLRTVVEIVKPLGNDCWWVKGALGNFKMREYLIRENYELEKNETKRLYPEQKDQKT